MVAKALYRLTWKGLLLVSMFCGGCDFGQAAVDGLYGGISNTVATVVSNALLDALGL
jgi:hypothetical protein